ncbi:unnamed protein product [Callosobruchus maculatus]|uniref:Uncharacterized protein n=1 Tax=Callosobruchus maculatus TaxID=64391 RepID=A0A653C473_CALMS|nr:unnamed protein product [Callosobruchus maculatus]
MYRKQKLRKCLQRIKHKALQEHQA